MPFQVSPGVNVTEIDLTTVVPAVSSTEGAIAGVFRWGPVNQRILVDAETNLAARFGKPTSFNAETFFTAANFLSYGNKLYVVRAANTIPLVNTSLTSSAVYITASGNTVSGYSVSANAAVLDANNTSTITAVATTGDVTIGQVSKIIFENKEDYTNTIGDANDDSDVLYAAKYPGELGNSLRVSICDSTNAFSQAVTVVPTAQALTVSGTIAMAVGSNTATISLAAIGAGTLLDANTAAQTDRSLINAKDVLEVTTTSGEKQRLRVVQTSTVDQVSGSTRSFTITFDNVLQTSANVSSTSFTRYWEFADSVESAPGQTNYQASFGNTAAQDELHVVVVDEGGAVTGVPGTILEVFQGLSRATDAKDESGAAIYYADVINDNSNYLWFVNHRSGAAANTAASLTSSTNSSPLTLRFVGGIDGKDESTVPLTTLARGYDLFASAEDVDVSLVLQGKARGSSGDQYTQLSNYIIDNVVELRKDCVAFVSPDKTDVVSNVGDIAASVVEFRNVLRSTSYAVMDSGYKYQYDKYNDVYRWVPLNGDTAGLCVRTDSTRDPWWSPAGFNRGQIKNIVKLAFNPSKAQRDILYKNGVNPVVTFPGQGTVLYGDKTLLNKPSAFDRINVRRLFIVLEKAIATAAKFTLFEFNDDFTRSQFRNLVEPFLRDIQGRRGIYDFKVVCDTTNNTGEVIDRNEFIGDIYIKPAKSINFIQLNMVAVRTGVEFSEIVGKF